MVKGIRGIRGIVGDMVNTADMDAVLGV